jgi:hypothetical protein
MLKMDMMFLGKEQRVSGKTGKAYYIAKFLLKTTGEIFEFYVRGDNEAVVTMIANLDVATDCAVQLKLVSNRGKAELNLAGAMAK